MSLTPEQLEVLDVVRLDKAELVRCVERLILEERLDQAKRERNLMADEAGCFEKQLAEARAKCAEVQRRFYGAAAILCEEQKHTGRRPCGWCLENTGYNSATNDANSPGQPLLDRLRRAERLIGKWRKQAESTSSPKHGMWWCADELEQALAKEERLK